MGWMDGSLLVAIAVAGVILILLGLKRDDVIRPIFLLVGLALVVFAFGGQFLGWKF
ncbi:MAG: hypothetical protein Q8W45_08805 [Candidatus Palauibacterales bacterium]|jgi:hypothetical protein|nr:hypothetical protein [Candidatus Palauibacterales bacterium]MDP2483366.1 hypothetical protein [Candidatus Palauibacterales bacterium]